VANPLAPNQTTFASRFTADTGLDGGVVTAWLLAEESSTAAQARNAANDNNWLNIASDVGAEASDSIWSDPNAAADASADWLKGQNSVPNYGRASLKIQAILNTAGQSAQTQIAAIQKSGWATSGYPTLPTLYAEFGKDAPAASSTPNSTPANQSTGSGTFTVGETSNPYEDLWTAINRLAQEVNWYVYTRTDAPQNVLFLADGTALLQQKPIATIDRWADQARILYIDFTWDNTAFEYKSQHKKRTKVSGKSNVATVASPTECTLHLICNIDAFNPGDVIALTNCGPGNGPWLVGEIRRSIFQIYSEITLVPGITPITSNAGGASKDISENLNISGTGTVGTSSPGSGNGAALSVGGYTNPLAQIQGLRPERTDMGVDYSGSGPILSATDGIVRSVFNSGWPNGTFICIEITNGSMAGKWIYYAEDITPKVAVGQKVKAGDVIGQMFEGKSGIEIGWNQPGTPALTLAAAYNQQYMHGDAGSWESAAGASMSRFLQSLNAPGGTGGSPITGGPHGQNPSGYP
jgi:hypothetical protein